MQLVSVPLDGVPSTGVTSVGDVANTSDPVPVSSLIAVRRFALDGEFGAEAIMMGEIAAEIKVKNTTATSAMWQAG